tara:strand:+ start:188 stop:568 length:381 start_codon:yes stop_codon:yes gene_type:complete
MKYIFLKLIISSGIITIVSEVSKKSSFVGGLVASISLIFVLSMIWLYIDSRDIEKIKILSTSIFWMVIPSLVLFLSIPILINIGFNFWDSLIIAIILTIAFYLLTIFFYLIMVSNYKFILKTTPYG